MCCSAAGIWGQGQTFAPDEKKSSIWIDRHSRYDTSNARAIAEDELLAMSTKQNPTTVLNLAGLWGNGRSVRNFMSRVIKDKESLANKNALYMVAGQSPFGLRDLKAQLLQAMMWHKSALLCMVNGTKHRAKDGL